MQEHHDVLAVRSHILGRQHDQRGGKQVHFLHRHMAVHPVGAGHRRKVKAARLTGFQQRQRQVRHAVLHIGRDLAMPVDDRFDIKAVGQIHPEPLTRVQDQALSACRIGQTVNRGRAAVDLQHPRGCGQRKRCRLPEGEIWQGGRCSHGRSCGQKAAARKFVVHHRAPRGPSGPNAKMDMPHVGGSGSSVAAQVGGAQGGVRRKRRPSRFDFAKPLNETNAKNPLRKGRAFNLVRPKAEGRTKRSPHFVMDIPRTSHGFVGLPGVHHRRRWFMLDSGHTNMGDIQRSQHDKRKTEAQRPAQTAKRGSIAFHQVKIGIGGTLGKSRFRVIRARRTNTSDRLQPFSSSSRKSLEIVIILAPLRKH